MRGDSSERLCKIGSPYYPIYSPYHLVIPNQLVIPHPGIIDTMNQLSDLSEALKSKVYFTHLNHTNDACRVDSAAYKLILDSGFNILDENQKFELS